MSMEPVDLVLSRLERPREIAQGRWRARCPGHDGRNPGALSITRGDDGRVLLRCWAGCDVERVAGAIGLDLHDLFVPASKEHRAQALRHPFISAQVFDIVRAEVGLVAVIASDMHRKREISAKDFERLQLSHQRLDEIARGAYGRR